MAITTVFAHRRHFANFFGLASDTKPTASQKGLVANISMFIETDTQNQFLWTGSLWATMHGALKTGSYTGDGATSLAVTVGFQPRYVKIWERNATDGTAITSWETTDEILDDMPGKTAVEHSGGSLTVEANTVIAFSSTGFTVDDAGANAGPNTVGQVYNYLAIG